MSTDDNKVGTLDVLLLNNAYCRSQRYLSKQLAQLRPELTMSMFSEITHRFQTAREDVRALLLQCLLPWLQNMELVATSVPPATPLSYIIYFPDLGTRGRREGTGSTEATEMILNNLFYITAKFSDSHPRDVEELWGTLCQFWPNNLKVILRYLVIMSGMAPQELLPYAKRVALYLARSCPDRLLDELMAELQTVETLNCLIERTETPPFYRLTSMRKASSHSADGQATGMNDSRLPDLTVEKGTIHTKRHSGEDPIKTGTCKSDSGIRAFTQSANRPPRGADKIRAASGPSIMPRPEDILINDPELRAEDNVELRSVDAPTAPHPLPMPEYGGWFAPLTEFLPDVSQPISGFHRCNVAVMLLTDIVVDGIPGVDWTLHLPLMLHILFLGLDHTRVLVREHCKQLCINLLIVLAEHNDHFTVARILLNSETSKLLLGLTVPTLPVIDNNFTESNQEFDAYLYQPSHGALTSGVLNFSSVCHTVQYHSQISAPPLQQHNTSHAQQQQLQHSQPHVHTNLQQPPPLVVGSQQQQNVAVSVVQPMVQINPNTSENSEVPLIIGGDENTPPMPGPTMPVAHVTKSLLKFLTQNNSQPLWYCEDITAKVWSVKSAEQLSSMLRHCVKVFADSYPQARIAERWAQTALQLGLSCSSRHYAGRCLQIFRALYVPISSRMLSDILSRLVETVAEQGEDMQGYVTELLLTLEAAVDSLDSDFRPLDVMKDIFKSTPNLNNKDGGGPNSILPCKKSPSNAIGPHSPNFSMPSHARSTSYSVAYSCAKRSTNSPCDKQVELRNRASGVEMERSGVAKFGGSALSRSRSAQSLKMLGDTATQDDKMTILAQLFWLSVSLLESDYEHEFLLALRLLTRVLHRLPLDRPDARDKVEKLQQQLKWVAYPGVHALLLKGCTHTTTYEPTITLLAQCAPLLSLPVVDPTQSCAFPMNVIALLPYMLLHYEDANEVCIRSAENIAQVASELGAKLENLGTVMTLYSRKTFCKESFQWTKCVVKYLHDTYAHMGLHMLAFLIEVLEKGPQPIQVPVLNVIHCMLHYVDLSAPHAQTINSDLLRAIGKYLDTVNWKDALKILKLIVTRSSSLQVVPPSNEGVGIGQSFSFYGAYPDPDVFGKKELAGRTMEFTFDVSQTPLIGRRILLKTADGNVCGNSSGIINVSVGSASGGSGSSSIASIGTNATTTTNTTVMTAVGGNASVCAAGGNQRGQYMASSGLASYLQHANATNTAGTPNSPRRSASLSPADSAPLSGWKRPWMSQGRVREGLVNLLTTCGQRVGLPKSPSDDFINSICSKVIFSQSSDLMERQSSASSTEETSGPQGDLSSGSRRDDGQPDFTVFKDFDFLEYEDSIAGESTDNFNWGVRRHPLFEGDEDALYGGGGSSSMLGMNAIGGCGPNTSGYSARGGGHSSTLEDSFSDKTPILSKRRRGHLAEDSSDEEAESESPLDEDHRHTYMKSTGYDGGPPTTLSLRERRRRNSVSRSDTSGSSAGDLGDITPCNASPHLPGIIRFGAPIRDEAEENWRKQLQALLVNQPSAHATDLLQQLHRLIRELTFKTISVSKEARKFFTGIGSQLGYRISLFTDLLSSRSDPPRVWCNGAPASTARLFEMLRFNVLEIQEHLETFFDRKDQVLECLDAVKTSCKLSLFTEADVAASGMDLTATSGGNSSGLTYWPFDPASTEVVLDLGRALYKLMFQLLLLIESNHKISSNVVNSFRRNENIQDNSDLYALVRDALMRSISEAELESLDTSTSTEGEHTPTPSPGPPMTSDEFETILQEYIDAQKWPAAVAHVRQYRRLSVLTASDSNLTVISYTNLDNRLKFDEMSMILNAYAQYIMKDRSDAFIVSKSDSELSDVYAILSENLYHVSSALTTMEINMKSCSNNGSGSMAALSAIVSSDIVTNL